jgi:hypothetical protein
MAYPPAGPNATRTAPGSNLANLSRIFQGPLAGANRCRQNIAPPVPPAPREMGART